MKRRDGREKHNYRILFWCLRIVAGALLIGAIGIVIYRLRDARVEDVLTYTPEHSLLAVLFLLLLYAVVWVIFIFPIFVLYIAVGILFPTPVALLLNLAGLALNVSLPYLFSSFAGRRFFESLAAKYRKIGQIEKIVTGNQWFLAYILRAVNLLPVSGVSLFMGATGIGYKKYLTATMAGMVPTMIAVTILGDAVMTPMSPQFLISFSFVIIVTVVSVLAYLYLKKRGKK